MLTCQHHRITTRGGKPWAVACRRPAAWRLVMARPRREGHVCGPCLMEALAPLARLTRVLIERM
ncbi:MAG: hypothetical protein EPO40_16670 [Myxococcaceae bacterium]|nr:MAG: hypothetical protein EPO40_16670 [Myxococcaceae bacterium]